MALQFLGTGTTMPQPVAQQVVLVIVDDAGPEWFGLLYGEGNAPVAHPPTPFLDSLAGSSRVFLAAYSMPACSPTRATIYTGAYPWRHGMGAALRPEDAYFLEDRETFADYLRTSLVGKWHLGCRQWQDPVDPTCYFGFTGFIGTRGNVHPTDETYDNFGMGESFACRGTTWQESQWATERTTDDALLSPWKDAQVRVVAYHALHTPLSEPPGGWTWQHADPQRQVAGRNLELLDAELGRLVSSLDLGTTLVLLCSDNGTAGAISDLPGPKGTCYEGGIRVPLVAFGAGVVPGMTQAQVSLVDLGPTIAEAMGYDFPCPDGVSLLPFLGGEDVAWERIVFAEKFNPPGFGLPRRKHLRAARDGRWKVVRDVVAGTDEFYDLQGQAPGYDGPQIPAAGPYYDRLAAYLDAVPLP